MCPSPLQCNSEEQCVNWIQGLTIAWTMARKASGLGAELPAVMAMKQNTLIAARRERTTSDAALTHAPQVVVAVDGTRCPCACVYVCVTLCSCARAAECVCACVCSCEYVAR